MDEWFSLEMFFLSECWEAATQEGGLRCLLSVPRPGKEPRKPGTWQSLGHDVIHAGVWLQPGLG